LKKAGRGGHVLNLSPPLNLNPKWFESHVAYTMAKYGMSMCVLGMAAELAGDGVAVNALWPRTAIATAAMNMLGGDEAMEKCRTPEIMADAAYVILTSDPKGKGNSGNFFLDDEVLLRHGVKDLSKYSVKPGEELLPDFFVD
ncbi:MAG: SDR family oxidoreductase, partial [Myxococcaceae bacterium]